MQPTVVSLSRLTYFMAIALSTMLTLNQKYPAKSFANEFAVFQFPIQSMRELELQVMSLPYFLGFFLLDWEAEMPCFLL